MRAYSTFCRCGCLYVVNKQVFSEWVISPLYTWKLTYMGFLISLPYFSILCASHPLEIKLQDENPLWAAEWFTQIIFSHAYVWGFWHLHALKCKVLDSSVTRIFCQLALHISSHSLHKAESSHPPHGMLAYLRASSLLNQSCHTPHFPPLKFQLSEIMTWLLAFKQHE